MALTKLDPNIIGQDSTGAGKITSAGGSVSIDSSGNVRIANSSANTILFAADGNIGINTPSMPLRLNGKTLAINGTTSGQNYQAGIEFQTNTASGGEIWYNTSQGMVISSYQELPVTIRTNNTDRFVVGSNGAVSVGAARLDPLGTAINPAPSGRALYNYNPYLPAGLYYFKNSAGTTQQLYCDVPNGGWVLYASSNANDTTIPSGAGRNSTSYYVNRNGTNGALGTASPNSDYLIGGFLDTFAFDEVRCVAYGRNSLNNTYNYSNLGTYLVVSWRLTNMGTNRYTEVVPRANIYVSGNSTLASGAAYFVMDAVRMDYTADSSLNANADQSTIGIAGTSTSSGDPYNGTYLGHGSGEGSYEGWYDGSNAAQSCQGYTSWCR